MAAPHPLPDTAVLAKADIAVVDIVADTGSALAPDTAVDLAGKAVVAAAAVDTGLADIAG